MDSIDFFAIFGSAPEEEPRPEEDAHAGGGARGGATPPSKPGGKEATTPEKEPRPEEDATGPEDDEGEKDEKRSRRRRQQRKKAAKKQKVWYPGRDKIAGASAARLQGYWEKHREEWVEKEPELQHITETGVENNFLLGCEVCMAYSMAHPEEKSCRRCKLAKGEHPQVRKADLLRHVNGGDGTLHQKAQQWRTKDAEEDEAEANSPRHSTMHPRAIVFNCWWLQADGG